MSVSYNNILISCEVLDWYIYKILKWNEYMSWISVWLRDTVDGYVDK